MDRQERTELARRLAERVFHGTELACFVRGTRIDTEDGPVAVEDLREGMGIVTMDHGLQPLRRVLCKRVSGMGRLAPVVIAPWVFGNGSALRVSPHHRMLVTGWRAEIVSGAEEVLAAAGDLVNGRDVCVEPVAEVDYFHLLMDRHEIIYAEEAATESYHPFAADAAALSPETLRDFAAIFAELAAQGGPGQGRAEDLRFWDETLLGAAARPCARPEEAALLRA